MYQQVSQPHGGVRDQIAKTVLRLASEHGTDTVTILDVSKAMGMSRATMDRYSPSEADLWRIATGFVENRMVEWWSAAALAELPPAKKLRSLVSLQIGLFLGMPALRELLFSRGFRHANVALQEGLAQIRGRLIDLVQGILLDGMEQGEFPRALDAERTARRIVEMLQGMAVGWPFEAAAEDTLQEAWERVEFIVRLSGSESAPAGLVVDRDAVT
jgi:AcrR family transcriptional regulator